MATFLDAKLECPKCGTITLDIPEGAGEDTAISCSKCGTYLGNWGDLQEDFHRLAGEGVFDVNRGRFRQLKTKSRK
jgi:hypothetical protein